MEGIIFSGTIVLDYVKTIDEYPAEGMLSTISNTRISLGGCVSTCAKAYKKLSPDTAVSACAFVGTDAAGEYIRRDMRESGVDISQLRDCAAETSTTDVMTSKKTGQRTFFHNQGASSIFSSEDIDYQALRGELFHIGYVMAMAKMDTYDAQYGTGMAKTLARVRALGIKTSLDLVSSPLAQFPEIARHGIAQADYLIVNEFEAGAVAGIAARDAAGALLWENMPRICERLIDFGLRERVVVHCPEGAFTASKGGAFVQIASQPLPKGFIKSTVGAGDAFAAGMLHQLANRIGDERQALAFANAVAAYSLSEADSTSGIPAAEQVDLHLNAQL